MVNSKKIRKYITVFSFLAAFFSLNQTVKAEIRVVTTIQPLHSLIANVMDGSGKLNLILEGSASPHSFTLKPSHAKMIEKADIIFWFGEELEAFLEKPLKSIPKKAKVISFMELSEVPKLKFREKNIFDHDEHGHKEKDDHKDEHGHAHGEFDVHLWLDPSNAKIMVKKIAHVLSEADPANAKKYEQNANKTRLKIDKMIKDIDSNINKRASFITFHDAYQYFEKRFGIASMGTLTVNPDVQPGAKQVSEIQKLIKEKNIKCIFSEPQFNPKIINMLTQKTNTKTGVFDPLGSKFKTGKSLYFDVINDLAKNLKGC